MGKTLVFSLLISLLVLAISTLVYHGFNVLILLVGIFSFMGLLHLVFHKHTSWFSG